jgi:hypothetical protein
MTARLTRTESTRVVVLRTLIPSVRCMPPTLRLLKIDPCDFKTVASWRLLYMAVCGTSAQGSYPYRSTARCERVRCSSDCRPAVQAVQIHLARSLSRRSTCSSGRRC